MAGIDPLFFGADPGRARALCVFLHGRGQSPEEMVETVLRHLEVPGVSYVLPRAGGGAWYGARAIDPLTTETRVQLAASLAMVRGAVALVRAAAPGRPLVLAGFSQGACLAVEYLAAGSGRPEAVLAFTGCRVGLPDDQRPETALAGLPVYLSAGDADPWIPLAAFADAAQSLGRMGACLRADIFPDRAHEVSAAERAMLGGVLADLAAGRPAAMGVNR